jgi:hypothetical protein
MVDVADLLARVDVDPDCHLIAQSARARSRAAIFLRLEKS